MDGFLNWFFAFITTMFGAVWEGIKGIFKAIFAIFDFKTYFGFFSNYSGSFGAIDWILSIICMILVYAFWAGFIFLIILGVKKYLRFRSTIVANEDLLEEIADLHRDVIRLTKEKEKIIELKYNGQAVDLSQIEEEPTEEEQISELIKMDEEEKNNYDSSENQKRFYRLSLVDEKYESYIEPVYNKEMSLEEICDDFRNYACSVGKLFYDEKTIRLMFSGLASTKLIILQGISGTGKTSLPYIMGKYFINDATIASVQPSWRDRAELFGFFNEFTKKFNETEVLRRIYESSYNDDLNIIVLDEMNIARVEYYFAEMLSMLEMPDPEEWKIQLVPSVWDNDPLRLEDGKLKIPQNVWYVGTANNDDSTFSVSDKVYDRALIINLDKKGVPFEAEKTEAKRISYSYLDELFDKAVSDNPLKEELINKIGTLDNYVIEHFRIAFGNRIMKQLQVFVPVYVACGGTDLEAIDYILATKVFRKFESLNLTLIRDEIKGLISTLESLFGKNTMNESIEFLRRMQKSY